MDALNSETNFKAYEFWTKLLVDERLKFLSENDFWDGLSYYLYDYLPDDLKTKILLKMA